MGIFARPGHDRRQQMAQDIHRIVAAENDLGRNPLHRRRRKTMHLEKKPRTRDPPRTYQQPDSAGVRVARQDLLPPNGVESQGQSIQLARLGNAESDREPTLRRSVARPTSCGTFRATLRPCQRGGEPCAALTGRSPTTLVVNGCADEMIPIQNCIAGENLPKRRPCRTTYPDSGHGALFPIPRIPLYAPASITQSSIPHSAVDCLEGAWATLTMSISRRYHSCPGDYWLPMVGKGHPGCESHGHTRLKRLGHATPRPAGGSDSARPRHLFGRTRQLSTFI